MKMNMVQQGNKIQSKRESIGRREEISMPLFSNSQVIEIDICDDESSINSDCILNNILSEQVSVTETLEIKDINDSCCSKDNQIEVVLYDSENDGDLIQFIQSDFDKQKFDTCTQDSNNSYDTKRNSASNSLVDREEILIESDYDNEKLVEIIEPSVFKEVSTNFKSFKCIKSENEYRIKGINLPYFVSKLRRSKNII